MYRKDYILQMIEMAAELIGSILGLIKKGELIKAQETLDNAYTSFLKEDGAFFLHLPIDNLTVSLLSKHDYNNGHLEILSELFFAQAELNFAQQQYSDSLECYQKSLILLEYVTKTSTTFSIKHQQKQMLLKKKVKDLKTYLTN
jgi:hypothetical protein